jgi:tRNA pseudouridine13 synthase
MSTPLPRAYGEAVLTAQFRVSPEDFFVEELLSFEPAGQGEHLLLTIEKRGMNTAFAARRIAQWAGIPEMGVGYAGMKDRHAVTRQRLSVHLPKRVAPDIATLQSDDLRVLESHWHNRKLPRGALAGNRFVIGLRDVHGDRDAIERRLADIRDHGLPNYFGEQRFGRDRSRHPASRDTSASMHVDGDNVEAARRMFQGQRVKREQRSIYLSAARSELFNAVLAARIDAGNWNVGAEGEVWMLDGSHSVFGPEPLSGELSERAARLDIHPTGPLWGAGELRSGQVVRSIEDAAVAPFADLRAGLEKAEMKQERRALRVRVSDLRWDWPEESVLRLNFALAPGAYATGLLAELGTVTAAQTVP